VIHGLVAFLAGAVFAVGLAIAGMTQPAKVVSFLDVTGAWDPSLAFVMGGALVPFALAYAWSRRGARRPVFAHAYPVLQSRAITARLVVGAAIFGVGWAVSGYCPGPAIASAGALSGGALLFVSAMFAGMALYHAFARGGVEPAAEERSLVS
jgi:hypothetical protein